MNEIKKNSLPQSSSYCTLTFLFSMALQSLIENCNTITEAYDYSKTIYLFIYYFFIFPFIILGARKVNGIYIERHINRNKW